MKYFAVAVVVLALFYLFRSNIDDATLMDAHEAYARGAIIIDVRTPSEYQSKHIDGAINLPLQSLGPSMNQLDKEKELIVYCRSGNRSATATKMLREKGFTVYDVATQADWERQIKATD